MTFLDFIRKVHEERKARGLVIKGGPGSGWFAPPKGTHGVKTKGKAIVAIKQYVPTVNLENLSLAHGDKLLGAIDKRYGETANRFMYHPGKRILLAGVDTHADLHHFYARKEKYDEFVKMEWLEDTGELWLFLDRTTGTTTEAWDKCFDTAKAMKACGCPDSLVVRLRYYSKAHGRKAGEFKMGEV